MSVIPSRTIALRTSHSTNSALRELANREPLPNGTVLYTWRQTLGRGQRQSRWLDTDGQGLALTVYLRPEQVLPSEQFNLSMRAALAACYCIEQYVGQKVQIKWPNDILAGEKKVTGILIENTLLHNRVWESFIGLGVNVYQTEPPLSWASSLQLQNPHLQVAPAAFVESLLRSLDQWLIQTPADEILPAYNQRLYGLGQSLPFEDDEGPFIGTVQGVSAAGQLRLSTAGGTKAFDVKSLKWSNFSPPGAASH